VNHWIVAPVLLPLVAGALLLVLESTGLRLKRALSVASTAALIPVALGLMSIAATGEQQIYYLGDWPAPFGIVLVLDHRRTANLLLGGLAGALRDRAGPRSLECPHGVAYQCSGHGESFLRRRR